jgi:hypothetical protein
VKARALAATAATILAAAALIGLAAPVGAIAAKTYHQRARTSAGFFAHATHGFSLYLLATDRLVIFSVHKDAQGQGEQSVDYLHLGRDRADAIDRGRLDVEVGGLGHFRGHFVATSTKTEKPGSGCTGDPTVTEEGYFVGSFVFHGERGYTSLHASREQGLITRQGATECRVAKEPRNRRHQGKRAEESTEKAAEEDEYRLVAADAEAHVVLQASREQVPPGPGNGATTTFQVSARGDKAGPFLVSHRAAIFDTHGAAATFLTPNEAEPLAEATLEPPAPFSGSATFQLETPKTASWTGDLAVELPGLGKLPLTGKKIYAGACRGHTHCTKTLPRQLQVLLEAGSGFDGSHYATAAVEIQTIS